MKAMVDGSLPEGRQRHPTRPKKRPLRRMACRISGCWPRAVAMCLVAAGLLFSACRDARDGAPDVVAEAGVSVEPSAAGDGQEAEQSARDLQPVPAATGDEVEASPPKVGDLPPLVAGRGGVYDITFDDLRLEMPVRTLFDPSMLTDRIRALDGREVRIRGFIYSGGVYQQTGITSFPLVMNTACKFGPQGLAYCVMLVELADGVTADFTTRPVTVEGTLSVQPFNSGGFTWSVYHVRGRRVR